MDFKERYKLNTNPFRITPAAKDSEIIWAGFKDIKNKFEKRIERSIRLPHSGIVLNWGEYGSGKTHAARYFNKNSTLKKIALKSDSPIPYSTIITLPKGKDPVYQIFKSIIDELDISEIRKKFSDKEIKLLEYIPKITNNLHIQSVLSAIFNNSLENISLLKKYLYGNITNTELKHFSQFGILRNLDSDNDYTLFLAGLFDCLTYNKKVFSSVILWIDEFEDLAILNSSNIDKTNNFLRELIDNTPNNLLIFLNLTQTALFGYEDLSQYVSEAVKSRIREVNNFELPTKAMFKEYLKELLQEFRIEGEEIQDYFPFKEDVIDMIIEELGNPSIRKFNDAFSLLLEIAEFEEECPISKSFFKENISEIIGIKEL